MQLNALWFVSPEDLAVLKAFSGRPRIFDDLVTLCAHLNGSSTIIAWLNGLERWTQALAQAKSATGSGKHDFG